MTKTTFNTISRHQLTQAYDVADALKTSENSDKFMRKVVRVINVDRNSPDTVTEEAFQIAQAATRTVSAVEKGLQASRLSEQLISLLRDTSFNLAAKSHHTAGYSDERFKDVFTGTSTAQSAKALWMLAECYAKNEIDSVTGNVNQSAFMGNQIPLNETHGAVLLREAVGQFKIAAQKFSRQGHKEIAQNLKVLAALADDKVTDKEKNKAAKLTPADIVNEMRWNEKRVVQDLYVVLGDDRYYPENTDYLATIEKLDSAIKGKGGRGANVPVPI